MNDSSNSVSFYFKEVMISNGDLGGRILFK